MLLLYDEQSQGELLTRLASRGFREEDAWSEHNPMLRGTMVRLDFSDVPIDLMAPRDQQEEEALARRFGLADDLAYVLDQPSGRN